MPNTDPYHPGATREYECIVCGNRVRAGHLPGACPNCGGLLLDVSVARE